MLLTQGCVSQLFSDSIKLTIKIDHHSVHLLTTVHLDFQWISDGKASEDKCSAGSCQHCMLRFWLSVWKAILSYFHSSNHQNARLPHSQF